MNIKVLSIFLLKSIETYANPLNHLTASLDLEMRTFSARILFRKFVPGAKDIYIRLNVNAAVC